MKSSKGCSLAAGIIDIILGVLLILLGIIGALVLTVWTQFFASIAGVLPITSVLGGTTLAAIGIIIFVLFAAVGIAYIIFGAKTVKVTKEEPANYIKSRGMLLAFAIVETVFLGFLIYSMATQITIATIVLTSVFAITLTLRYLGYGLSFKGAKNIPAPVVEQTTVTVKTKTEQPK